MSDDQSNPGTETDADKEVSKPEEVNTPIEGEESIRNNVRQDRSLNPSMSPLQFASENSGEDAEGQSKLIDMNFDEYLIEPTPVAAEQLSTVSANLKRRRSTKLQGPSTQISQRVSMISGFEQRTSLEKSRTSDPLGTMFEDIRVKIEAQNDEINELKAQLEAAENKFPQTADSRNEVNNVKKRIDIGLNKLNVLYKDARQIQERDPERAWPLLAFATTLDEDNDKSSGLDYGVVISHIEPLTLPADENTFCPHSTRSDSQESLFNRPRIRGWPRAYCQPEKVSATGLDRERQRLQEELACRDKVVERLHKKVLKMQAELAKLCREKQQQRFDSNSLNEGCNDSVLNTGADDDCEMFELLNKRFQKIQKDILNDDTEGSCPPRQQGDLRRKYCELLEEYAKKDSRIQKLQTQLEMVTSQSGENRKDPIVDILRRQLEECREENDSQRVIICEQADQIEDYHEKYLEALQKNEELKCVAKRLQMDNRKVEDQINMEIRQIKNKFESKLAEYAQFPKLLENEQMKLAKLTAEKQELERKLRVVCLEFQKLRDEHASEESENSKCRECNAAQDKLKDVLAQLDTMRQCYTAITNRFDSTKVELDSLRKESAKVICRLKGRAEEQRVKLQSHIHRLEGNLAKARAAVSITSADKETTIKDMQGQLNCLGMCLDSSQKQIKTLKDHIAYLNTGKTKSVVICCQTDEKNL